MNRISHGIYELHKVDKISKNTSVLSKLDPSSKLIVTLVYIIALVSFNNYSLNGVFSMIVYIFIMMNLGDIKFVDCISRLKYVIGFVLLIGIPNVIIDHEVFWTNGQMVITYGMVLVVTFFMKCVFSIMAVTILMYTTSIGDIFTGLRRIRVPAILVTVMMLMYRYIMIMLKEAERIYVAYSIRSGGRKGIRIKEWGPLLGQFMLRSMDRAENVYESMVLRGFDGYIVISKEKVSKNSILFAVIIILAVIVFRIIPVFDLIGKIFV